MLHILLLILKIIGMILLCILGILVLGTLCALFVPVRYRIEAVRQEGEGEPPVALQVKVTWFLHLVNLLIRFDGAFFLRACLAVITVFRLPKKEKHGRAAKSEGRRRRKWKKSGNAEPESEGASEEKDGNAIEETGQSEETAPDTQTAGKMTADREKNMTVIDIPADREEEAQETAETDKASMGKPSFFDKLRAIPKILRDIFSKIKSLFTNIQYTIQKFCDKINSVSGKITYYRDILEGEPFKRSFVLCKDELIAIVRSLKPDKFDAQLAVGLGDPAATGQILAVCGMLYPLMGGHVDVVGDFEEKRLEGRVFIKGKVRVFTFLRVAVKLYFNKDVKQLIKILKKGGSVNG